MIFLISKANSIFCWHAIYEPSHTELKGNTGSTVMLSSVSTVGLFTTGSHSLLSGSSAERWEPRLAGPRDVLLTR